MTDRLHDHLVNLLLGGVGFAMLTDLDLLVKILGIFLGLVGMALSVSREVRAWMAPKKP